MATSKQIGFERANDKYISLGPLDMVSTHVLLYDVEDLLNPKLTCTFRICYESRAKEFGLELPVDGYLKCVPKKEREAFAAFRRQQQGLVDLNAWFVHEDYTFSKIGLSLSDITLFLAILHVKRMGFDHVVGCTNEKFKASRWLMHIGKVPITTEFIHHAVPDPHRFILIDGFSEKWMTECFGKYSQIVEGQWELFAEGHAQKLKPIDQIRRELIRTPLKIVA